MFSKKIGKREIVVIGVSILLLAWGLVGRFTSPTFLAFFEEPVVDITIGLTLVASYVYARIADYEDEILREQKT